MTQPSGLYALNPRPNANSPTNWSADAIMEVDRGSAIPINNDRHFQEGDQLVQLVLKKSTPFEGQAPACIEVYATIEGEEKWILTTSEVMIVELVTLAMNAPDSPYTNPRFAWI